MLYNLWPKKENPRLDFNVGLFLGLLLGIILGSGLNALLVTFFL